MTNSSILNSTWFSVSQLHAVGHASRASPPFPACCRAVRRRAQPRQATMKLSLRFCELCVGSRVSVPPRMSLLGPATVAGCLARLGMQLPRNHAAARAAVCFARKVATKVEAPIESYDADQIQVGKALRRVYPIIHQQSTSAPACSETGEKSSSHQCHVSVCLSAAFVLSGDAHARMLFRTLSSDALVHSPLHAVHGGSIGIVAVVYL